MCPLVSFQLEHLRKGFAANIALEGPVFCMDGSDMVVEMVRRIKLSITVIAGETFSIISTGKMIPNVTFVCKFSETYIALIPFFSIKIHSFHNMLHILQVGPPSPPDVRRTRDGQGRADLLKKLLAGLLTPGDHILWPRASDLVILVIEVGHLAICELQLATVDIKPESDVLRSLSRDGEAALDGVGRDQLAKHLRPPIEGDALVQGYQEASPEMSDADVLCRDIVTNSSP